MLKKYFINKLLFYGALILFTANVKAQAPGLPNIEPVTQPQQKVDVEMLGLDEVDKDIRQEILPDYQGNNDDKKESANNATATENQQIAKQDEEVNIEEEKLDKDSGNKQVKTEKRQVAQEDQADQDKGKGGIFSKIKSFIEKNDKVAEVDGKKVINLKLIDEERESIEDEKTTEEIEREKKKRILVKQKQKRLQKLKEQYLLKIDQVESSRQLIVPKKKDLSWSDRFYVTKEMAPPLISRSRGKENSHIPIIPTFKERILSLFRTIRSNDVSAFNNLYRKIAIPDIRNSKGETILTYALLLKRHPVINSILAKGADPDLANSLGHTPLDIAIENMDLKSVKILIDNHADISYSDKYNRTFLMLAARKGYLPIVRLLVEKGADVNQFDSFGRTALSIALRHKKEIIAKYLLKNGASTWIEKPINESNQQFILELQNRWNNSVNIPQ